MAQRERARGRVPLDVEAGSLVPAWPGDSFNVRPPFVRADHSPFEYLQLAASVDRTAEASSQVTSRALMYATGPVRSEVRGVRIGGVGSARSRRSWKEICPELSPLTSHYFICIQSRPFPIL